jgi:hypothetical protein
MIDFSISIASDLWMESEQNQSTFLPHQRMPPPAMVYNHDSQQRLDGPAYISGR